jgi:hypothetical protein
MRLILFFFFAGCLHGYAYSQSVAVSGSYKAVGNIDADVMGVTGGAVYIFIKGLDGNWTEQAKVVAPDPVNADRFGYAVDIDGDYLIVGAPEKTINGNYSQGKAYIYKRQNNEWIHQVTFSKAGAGPGDKFGHDVAITTTSKYGVLALAGVPYYDNGLQNRGIVYVYRLDPETKKWSGSFLSAPRPQAESRFGFSVDADGDNLIVEAPRPDQKTNNNPGVIYIYHYNGTSWVNEGNKPGNSGIASYYP